MLPRHACCVLSRLCCNGHSLGISSYLSRIGKIENLSCSACGHPSHNISHFILHCPATDSLRRSLFGDCLSTTSGPGPGEPGFWGCMVFHHAPFPRQGTDNQQQQNNGQLQEHEIKTKPVFLNLIALGLHGMENR